MIFEVQTRVYFYTQYQICGHTKIILSFRDNVQLLQVKQKTNVVQRDFSEMATAETINKHEQSKAIFLALNSLGCSINKHEQSSIPNSQLTGVFL